MKPIAISLLIILAFGFTSKAQTLQVSFDSESKVLIAGEQLSTTITVNPPGNFQASIFLSVRSSLPVMDKNLNISILNAPYPASALLTYNTTLLDSGSHFIIIEAKNGQLIALDTLHLQIGRTEQWRKMPPVYDRTDNFYFNTNNELYSYDQELSSSYQRISKFANGKRINIDHMQKTITSLLIDDQQNIWTGSNDGIGKYDGQYWTIYPKTDFIRVSKAVMDMNGTLWFSGLHSNAHLTSYSMYLVKNGNIEKIDSIRKLIPGIETNNRNFRIYDICSDRTGNVFVLACPLSDSLLSPVLLKYNGITWARLEYPNFGKTRINSTRDWMRITSDHSENLWYFYDLLQDESQRINGLLKYDGTTWQDFNSTVDFSLPAENELSFRVTPSGIHADQKGNIWFVSASSIYQDRDFSLVRFDGANFITYNSKNSPLPYNTPTAIGIDSNNNVWMKCEKNTVVFNPNGIVGLITNINNQDYSTNVFKTIASPNPTQNSTTIHYSLKTESPVSISIYNSLGIEVFKSDLGFKNAGENSEIISTSELPSGQYYYVLKAGAQQSTQPLVIVR